MSVFASGTTGTANVVVCSDSRITKQGGSKSFAQRIYRSKVMDASKTLGRGGDALVQDVFVY